MEHEMTKSQMSLDEMVQRLKDDGIIVSKEKEFTNMIERGRALTHIHRNRLYKQRYHSFSACVLKNFGCTSQQAHNLIMASSVYDRLKDKFKFLPTNMNGLLDIYKESKKSGATYEEVWARHVGDRP